MVFKRLLVLGMLAISASALAADLVTVESAYVRGMPPGQMNTTAYMQLVNNSDKPLKLYGAKAAWAERIEVHSHTMSDGVMRMRKVDALELAPAAKVSLEPGGYHLMVFGLQRRLNDGEDLILDLQFDGGLQRIQLPVKSVLTKSNAHQHHH